MTQGTALKQNTATYPTEKLRRDKFALLAKVGHLKRVASRSAEETEFYYTTATEALALLAEALRQLASIEREAGSRNPGLVDITSRHHHLIRRLSSYWPQNSESQQRILNLLESDGLATVMGVTSDGYASLSSDLILENVARAIEVMKERNQRT